MKPQQLELIEPVAEVYADKFVTQSELDWLAVELVGLVIAAVVTGAVRGLLRDMLTEAVSEA